MAAKKKVMQQEKYTDSLDTGGKLNVYKTSRRRPGGEKAVTMKLQKFRLRNVQVL